MVREKWRIDLAYKETFTKILSENLASLRAKADITQEELANIIGISRQTYYAIETRKRNMSWNTYLSLLFFYDTNVLTHSMLRDIKAYPIELMVKMRSSGP